MRHGLRRHLVAWTGVAALVAAITVGTGPAASAQATINVPGGQPTIQAAINAASSGDTVLVAPGTYRENLNFEGKAITVESQSGPQATIGDGGNAAPVVTFSSSEGSSSVLKGFTLQHGSANFAGGGIDIEGSSPTILNNIVANNTACGAGGGIEVDFASPTIFGNVIEGNHQSACSGGPGGGGIEVGGAASAKIIGNAILDNSFGSGGGITLFAAGTPTISYNVISGNSSGEGGGMWIVNDSDASIVQNLIVGNKGPEGAGIDMLVPSGSTGPVLVNNTIAGNIGAPAVLAGGFDAGVEFFNNIVAGLAGQPAIDCDTTYNRTPPVLQFNNAFGRPGYAGSCAGAAGQNGNISADPLFVNAAGSNFHLQPGSPSLGAGTISAPLLPTRDADGHPRVVNGHVDQGVYEAQAGSEQSPVITTGSLPGAFVGEAYDAAVTATGGSPPYNWSITAGGLSPGLLLNAGSGHITGVPTAVATFAFTIGATDTLGHSGTRPLSLIVSKAPTVTNLSVTPAEPAFGDAVTFVATVAPAAPNSLPVTGSVSFYLDTAAAPLASVPVVGGQARFTAVGLGGGNHVAGALYSGDANFLVSSSSAQAFSVVASRNVTGSHVGSLVVASGSTVLLLHADLIGSVVVLPGGGVDIEGSTILGSVTADRPRAVRVCGSTIGGALNIDRPQGFVVVGPPGVGCASSSVRGAQR